MRVDGGGGWRVKDEGYGGGWRMRIRVVDEGEG